MTAIDDQFTSLNTTPLTGDDLIGNGYNQINAFNKVLANQQVLWDNYSFDNRNYLLNSQMAILTDSNQTTDHAVTTTLSVDPAEFSGQVITMSVRVALKNVVAFYGDNQRVGITVTFKDTNNIFHTLSVFAGSTSLASNNSNDQGVTFIAGTNYYGTLSATLDLSQVTIAPGSAPVVSIIRQGITASSCTLDHAQLSIGSILSGYTVAPEDVTETLSTVNSQLKKVKVNTYASANAIQQGSFEGITSDTLLWGNDEGEATSITVTPIGTDQGTVDLENQGLGVFSYTQALTVGVGGALELNSWGYAIPGDIYNLGFYAKSTGAYSIGFELVNSLSNNTSYVGATFNRTPLFDNKWGWYQGTVTIPSGYTVLRPKISVANGGTVSFVGLSISKYMQNTDAYNSLLMTLSGNVTYQGKSVATITPQTSPYSSVELNHATGNVDVRVSAINQITAPVTSFTINYFPGTLYNSSTGKTVTIPIPLPQSGVASTTFSFNPSSVFPGATIVGAYAYASNSLGRSNLPSVAESISLPDGKIYGVRFNKLATTMNFVRLGSAVGLNSSLLATKKPEDNLGLATNLMAMSAEDLNSEVGTKNDFDEVGPWSQIKEVKDSLGNTMVRIPKTYVRKTLSMDKTQGTWEVTMVKPSHVEATDTDTGWYLPSCFWDFGNNVELPYVEIGAYKANLSGDNLTSDSDSSVVVATDINKFRDYAMNNNKGEVAGYQLLDIHALDLLRVLYLIEFATLDTQEVLAEEGYRGITGLLGDVSQLIDGVNSKSGTMYVSDNANTYSSDTYLGDYTTSSSDKLTLSSELLNEDNTPSVGNSVLTVGGSNSLFTDTLSLPSNAMQSNVSARLMHKPL